MPNPFEDLSLPQGAPSDGAPTGAERRAAMRRPLRAQALVLLPGQPGRACRTLDISESGICVALAESLPPGTSCMVGFELPDRQGSRKRHQSRAHVVNSILAGHSDGFRVGMQFHDIPDAVLLAIQAYVRE